MSRGGGKTILRYQILISIYLKSKPEAKSAVIYTNTRTQGLFEGMSMYLAKKIADAAMTDGA